MNEYVVIAAVTLTILFVLLGSGVWVALSLFGVAYVAMEFFAAVPVGKVLPTTVWGAIANWPLTALPLFIWMGEILFRTRLAEDMFRGLAPWMARLPGRLLHVNVVGCGLFAAVSGSSAATAATVGRLTLPELDRLGYDRSLSIGSLAASGSLGMLIPPSIVMIVYGVAAEVSIARLFLAGILPGLLLMGLFMAYIMMRSLFVPVSPAATPDGIGFWARISALRHLAPVLALIGGVIGSIYSGIATPTEAAAVGVLGAFAISAANGSLSRQNFADALTGATYTSCMIAFIMATASFLSAAMGFVGLPRMLGEGVAAMNLGPYELIAALTLFFIVLGCFLDGISMVVLTTSVILPAVQATGIDLLWFGIYIVLVVEMSQITPPVGFNLFVVQSITGDDILKIARASFPFFLMMILAVLIIMAWPAIVTALPSYVTAR